MIVLHVLLAILGLSVLMIVHEGGHYLVARAFKMRVLRFSIGFGPTLFKHQPKGSPTIFQVGAIPFLAYVQIAGMNPHEEVDPNDPELFPNKSLLARVLTIAAGPIANYLLASVVVFFLAMNSWPMFDMPVVGETVPKDKTGSAMGLLGTTSAIGTALGPSLGGFLIAGLGWRALFLVKVPLGLLALLLAYRHLPEDREASEKSVA